MKKIILSVGTAFILLFASQVNAQAVEQGNIIIDPYYGFPNFGKKLAEGFETSGDVKVGGIGPLGLRAEYMLADKIGVGIDFIFNSTNLQFQADSLNSDGTVYETYDVKTSMRRIRVHARFNYHFIDNDKTDAYFGVGAGLNNRSWDIKTDFPNYDTDATSGALLPVSMRLCVGVRYYLTDNIGISGEIGIGGPIMSLGASFKF